MGNSALRPYCFMWSLIAMMTVCMPAFAQDTGGITYAPVQETHPYVAPQEPVQAQPSWGSPAPQQYPPQGHTSVYKDPEEKPVPLSRKDMLATIRIIEKITARFTEVTIPMGAVHSYKELRIYPKRCWMEASEYSPEHALLIGIYEGDVGQSPERIFAGWLFSKNQSLTSLEHAYYDISLLKCIPKGSDEAASSPTSAAK